MTSGNEFNFQDYFERMKFNIITTINQLMKIYEDRVKWCMKNCKIFKDGSEIKKCAAISVVAGYLWNKLIALNTFIYQIYLKEKFVDEKFANKLLTLTLTAFGLYASTKSLYPKSLLITKVEGESMKPTINSGDILIILTGQTAIEYLHKRGKPIDVGDIVAYIPPPEQLAISLVKEKTIPLIYHRIIKKEVTGKPGEVIIQYQFKGDANPKPDPWKLPSHSIVGLIVKVIKRDSEEWKILNMLLEEVA